MNVLENAQPWLYDGSPVLLVWTQLLHCIFTFLAKSSPVKQETSRTMILSKMVSVLWMHLCMFTEIQCTYSG